MNRMKGVPGIITAAQLDETVTAIAGVQLPDGNIPWTPGGHTDPWNLVEAAMALDLGGRHAEAVRAYEWLQRMQNDDASWHAYYVGNDIKDPTLDTNVACYVATGIWHHYLCTDDTAFLREHWSMVERTIDYALAYQTGTGEIAWRADDPADGALLTGSSSIHLSLRCAIAIAERLGHERPDWELSLGALAIAIAHRPERFLDKAPLGDGLVLPDPRWRAAGPGRAAAHHPLLGDVRRRRPRRALRLGPAVGHRGGDLRARDGARRDRRDRARARAVRLGAVPAQRRRRLLVRHELRGRALRPARRALHRRPARRGTPRPSCSRRHALGDEGPTAGLFRGEALPGGLSRDELLQAGVAIEQERSSNRSNRSNRSRPND